MKKFWTNFMSWIVILLLVVAFWFVFGKGYDPEPTFEYRGERQ